MIQHYLKIVFRNILKHKTQSIISIVGLAIGLACFALSTFWIQYEMTYDSFHRDADRIYLIRTDENHFGTHYHNFVPYALGGYLKNSYSEIEDWCAFEQQSFFTMQNKQLTEYPYIAPDSTFMRMMDVKILEGNNNFLSSSSNEKEVAITEEMARDLFGTTDVIGKELISGNNMKGYRISAVIDDWGKHSNFKYSVMGWMSSDDTSWGNGRYRMLIKVKHGTDINALIKKMNRNFPEEMKKDKYNCKTGFTRFYLEPITQLRYADEFVRGDETIVQFRYIVYFSITGVLIIFCALVNYLTIYSDCFRSRKREMALRKVNGASEHSLLALLCMDFLFTILLASILGMGFIELLKSWFIHYSGIADTDMSIYGYCILYIAGMSILAYIIALLSVYIFRRRLLQHTLHHTSAIGRLFRRGSVVLQLIVCIVFIFCTTIMQMQLYHLRNVNTGIDYQNRASLSIWMNVDMNVWAEKVKELPMVTEIVKPVYWPLISMGAYSLFEVTSWDGLNGTADNPISIDQFLAGEDFFKFYNMKLLAGEWISDKSKLNEVNITATAARTMGWTPEEAIGKRIYYNEENTQSMTIVGVVKDCAYRAPTNDVPNAIFVNTNKLEYMWPRCFVLFKYKPGTWEECRRRIEEMQLAELPDRKLFLDSEEERYNKYLKSEDALSGLLSFSSLVCILIAVFGIYSLVTLTCELRRKEIAVRKVNGATIGNILSIFFREYTLLLIISSLIAFPVGYIIMRQWIEIYNRQVNIGVWPFILIFMGIMIVITLSIGWRVWQAARQNPAEVIKSE